MEFLLELLMLAAIMVLFVNAVVEVIKRATNINTKFMPLVAVASGILVGLMFFPLPIHEYDLYTMLIVGFIAGLTASGTFNITKALKEISTKRVDKNG